MYHTEDGNDGVNIDCIGAPHHFDVDFLINYSYGFKALAWFMAFKILTEICLYCVSVMGH